MVGIKWADGTKTIAETPEEIEQRVRELQWDEYGTQEEFRAEMARRARIWSGVEIDVDGSSADFLMELERAQMLSFMPWVNEQPTRLQA